MIKILKKRERKKERIDRKEKKDKQMVRQSTTFTRSL